MEQQKGIYAHLPDKIIPNDECEQEGSDRFKSFLKELLPSSDLPKIDQDLRRTFLLNKYKVRKSFDKNIESRTKKTYITRKEKNALGLTKIHRKGLKYEDLIPLHNLWKSYIIDFLDLEKYKKKIPTAEDKNWENFSLSLLRADYHGAVLTVVRSRCPSLVGRRGICAMDTKNTFVLVGEDNDRETYRNSIQYSKFSSTV